MLMDIGRGALGIAVLLGALYLLSADRRRIDWKLVFTALLFQIILGIAVLKVDWVRDFFSIISGFFLAVIDCTEAGVKLVFGDKLIDPSFAGYIFAVKVLPTVIFFSALSSILYYFGILQKIIYGLAWAMTKVMRISGAEGMAAGANVFLGQTEAPLVIKPYVKKMTKSELLCLMVGGMATIAGGVLAAYVGFLGGESKEAQADFALHLLTASIMSAPAAILAAKMLYPETEEINRDLTVEKDEVGDSLLTAIAKGTSEGLGLAVNVAAMLIVFTALIFMVNKIFINTAGTWVTVGSVTLNEHVAASTGGMFTNFTVEYMLGNILAPVAWLLGVAWQDSMAVGQLLGQKTILNEFVAYANMPAIQDSISYKSEIITIYALCGFSNFASIGIQIGGIGTLAPNRKADIANFGIKALIGGTAACFFTAVIAGAIVGDIEGPIKEKKITPPPPVANTITLGVDSLGVSPRLDTLFLSKDTLILKGENGAQLIVVPK